MGGGDLSVSGQEDVLQAEDGRKVLPARVEPAAWASRKSLKQPGGKRQSEIRGP